MMRSTSKVRCWIIRTQNLSKQSDSTLGLVFRINASSPKGSFSMIHKVQEHFQLQPQLFRRVVAPSQSLELFPSILQTSMSWCSWKYSIRDRASRSPIILMKMNKQGGWDPLISLRHKPMEPCFERRSRPQGWTPVGREWIWPQIEARRGWASARFQARLAWWEVEMEVTWLWKRLKKMYLASSGRSSKARSRRKKRLSLPEWTASLGEPTSPKQNSPLRTVHPRNLLLPCQIE